MSLIFDSFPNIQKARAFKQCIEKYFHLKGRVFLSPNASFKADPFPWVQHPPIVHIERTYNFTIENCIAELAEEYGGTFLGT